MVYSVLSIESLDSVTPAADAQVSLSRAGMKMSMATPACSDSLIRLLNGSPANGTLEILEQFFQHLAVTNASRGSADERGPLPSLQWGSAMKAISDSRSIEQAIGRAVVIADQLHPKAGTRHEDRERPVDTRSGRRSFDHSQNTTSLVSQDGDPFFSFSVADSLPDFGDESRYRTRLANKVGRMLKPRRVDDAAIAS